MLGFLVDGHIYIHSTYIRTQIKCTANISMFTYLLINIFMLNLVLKEPRSKRYLCRVNLSDLYAGYMLVIRFDVEYRDLVSCS